MDETDKIANEINRLKKRRRELAKQCFDLARADDMIGYMRMLDVLASITVDISTLRNLVHALNEAPPYGYEAPGG